jgi:hypothetical protein
MSRIGGPIYDPTSVASGVGGPVHSFARYRGIGGVVLHPLQRAGMVSADSHAVVGAQGAHGPNGLGDPFYAAAAFDMRLPPVVPIAGGPRDPRFMV